MTSRQPGPNELALSNKRLILAACVLVLTILACNLSTLNVPAGEAPTLSETATVTVETSTPTQNPTHTPTLTDTPAPTNTPTATVTRDPSITCATLNATWGNWPAVLYALEQLIAAGQSCGSEPLLSKKYAAHFNYGKWLEDRGDLDSAVMQYQAAFYIDTRRQEALLELIHLGALPEPTPFACHSPMLPNPDPAPANEPDPASFITVQDGRLQLDGQPFKVRGVNYYPRHAPWFRFLEDSDLNEMAVELDLIQQAGFNTIRVFLRYDPLFTCQPEHAIPNETAFAKVDALFQMARERDLKLIVTINDLPDLYFRPLYTDWERYDAQTTYIVRRYRNEPGILAWDLRNEGDLDYGADGRPPNSTQEEVITWLAHVSQLVREHDPYHLTTAGWWDDPTETAPYVDILSFHHWTEAYELATRIDDYRQRSDKPLLLEEVGYHSWAQAPYDQRGLAGQADILGRVVGVAEEKEIAGWLVWTAFDFVREEGQPPHFEHFFGLWGVDLTPKPALDALP